MPEKKSKSQNKKEENKTKKKTSASTGSKKKTSSSQSKKKTSTSPKKKSTASNSKTSTEVKKRKPKKITVEKKSPPKEAPARKPKEQPQEIDSQKKFYRSLSQEIEQKYLQGEYSFDEEEKEKGTKDQDEAVPKKSIGLYKKRAFLFIGLTVLLLLGVFYFSFARLTITITPQKETVNNNLLLDIYNQEKNPYSSNSLSGAVIEITATKENTYKASGEEVIGEDIEGTVDLINNYSQNQPLVATTRLLSPDDKLYRISEGVNIPAGGKLEDVEIYTEEISSDMAIGPTRFIIPGLWSGLQDDIYAESNEKFEYVTNIEKFIKESDFEKAKEDLNSLILKDVKEEAKNLYNGEQQILYKNNPSEISIETSASTGDETEEFTVKGENDVQVVVFSKEEAQDLVKKKINLLIPESKHLIEFNPDNLIYTLDNFNQEEKKATIKVSFSGTMALKQDAEIVDRKKLVNLNREQIESYLNNIEEVKDYEINFSPSFVSKAPSLVDRINIRVRQ